MGFSMNCTPWNCSGTGSKALLNLVRDLVRKPDVRLFAILEPRVSDNKAVKRVQRKWIKVLVRIDSKGFLGGIWVMWNPDIALVSVQEFSSQLIHLVTTLDGNYETYTTFVYASP